MPALRCLFVVQGEGRGHMTQALALRRILHEAGHEVAGVLVGRSARREVPDFFRRKIAAPLVPIDSPNFVLDGAGRAVRLDATVVRNVARAGRFRRALGVVDDHVRRLRPDVVVNFFEPLAGLYYRRARPAAPMVCVGHQYLLLHPGFPFPSGGRLERRALVAFTRLTAWGAARRLALSFRPERPMHAAGVTVVPPLLRAEVLAQPRGRDDGFLLAYVLNDGYASAVARWQQAHPDAEVHLFRDRPGAAPVERPRPGLFYHRLDDDRFLSMMARCRGLVTTAGFESVCEAMYLGKPVLAVPVEGHYEQRCNAADAVRAGAGVSADTFDVDRLLAYLPRHRPDPAFRAWAATAAGRFVEEIEGAARTAGRLPAAMQAA